MESMVDVGLSEERSEGVGEKRIAVEDEDFATKGSPSKRIKDGRGGGLVLVADVKKVADMVLMLAAMGKMRGARGPTEAERELMNEARNGLVKICQGFAPKDVFPLDAFGGLIEDLGLNKLKEQRLGIRPPKISIAEKLLISKRKMERAEDFSLSATTHSSQYLQGKSVVTVESHTALYPARTSPLDKSIHLPISPGNLQSASPLTHGVTSASTPLPYQLPTSEIRPTGSSALPSSHMGSIGLPRVDRSQLRSDGRLNGSLLSSQAQTNYSANTTVRTPMWSVQPPSIFPAKTIDTKVAVNTPLKVEGAADNKSKVATQAASIAVAQSASGSSSQGTNQVQTSPGANIHTEIGKMIKKLLHPRGFERPIWNPPSRDYMNKAITCQMCTSTITEIDNVLICDGCEKGYHLKCLQATNHKVVPRVEWHCGKCLSLSNGKSLPPKYGRVMRNITTPKVPSNSAAVPSSASKEDGSSAVKVVHTNENVNGNHSMQQVSVEVEVNSAGHQATGSRKEDDIRTQDDDSSSSRLRTDSILYSGDNLKNVIKTSASASSSIENTCDGKVAEIKPNPLVKLEMVPHSSDNSGVVMVNTHCDNKNEPNVEQCQVKNSLNNHLIVTDSSQLKDQEVALDNPAEIASSTVGVMKQDRCHSHVVNWVGDSIQTLDAQTYYSSCFIDGHIYKAMDHVLIRFENGKRLPSRLLAMCEDNNTKTKWVSVHRCYFPSDLPEGVGRPCGLESSEVYESSCATQLMAGSIEGPCQVLPPRKFAEESERRSVSGMQQHLPPLYLCKWIYDEAKGLFRDISC